MRILNAVLCLGAAVTVSVPACAQSIQINQQNKTIAISATDEAGAVADVAGVTVGFEIFGPDSETTYKKGGDLSHAILGALHKAGIKDDAIESADQGLQRNTDIDDKSTPEERAQRQFVLRQSWTVSVPPKFAGDLIKLAVAAGANKGGSIDWRYSDRKALQAKAAANALGKARAIAQQMADGMHVKLGALIYASNEAPTARILFARPGPRQMEAADSLMVSTAMEARDLEILPQEVREEATVYAVFAIE